MMEAFDSVLVLGLGASGAAAADLLLEEGAAVTVLDAADTPVLRRRAVRLSARGARVQLGATGLPAEAADVAVVSPGLRMDAPWVVEAWHRGLPLISELELGWSRRRCPVVAVTGSNGKSTTVKLLCEVLSASGLRAAPAGNFGPPLSTVGRRDMDWRRAHGVSDDAVLRDLDWLVVEVSSFQLEWSEAFRAEVGLLLNVQPNHLDRHGTMETYLSIKARLFAHTGRGDVCLVPAALHDTVRGLSEGRGHWTTFGSDPAASLQYRPGGILADGQVVADVSGTRFDNPVAGPALAAVFGAAEACGVRPETVRAVLDGFEPLPHRMQPVARSRGVSFINDSKATTLSALAAAVTMCPPGVRLIAGGILKEHDLHAVKELLARRAGGVYLIGRSAPDLYQAWADEVPCEVCGDIETAVARAADAAGEGETVLLSPGCASFDQFAGFEERGERFTQAVQARLHGDREIAGAVLHQPVEPASAHH